MIVTYRQLSDEARRITYDKYVAQCDADPACYCFESFEEYDEEQQDVDFCFDLRTLECVG